MKERAHGSGAAGEPVLAPERIEAALAGLRPDPAAFERGVRERIERLRAGEGRGPIAFEAGKSPWIRRGRPVPDLHRRSLNLVTVFLLLGPAALVSLVAGFELVPLTALACLAALVLLGSLAMVLPRDERRRPDVHAALAAAWTGRDRLLPLRLGFEANPSGPKRSTRNRGGAEDSLAASLLMVRFDAPASIQLHAFDHFLAAETRSRRPGRPSDLAAIQARHLLHHQIGLPPRTAGQFLAHEAPFFAGLLLALLTFAVLRTRTQVRPAAVLPHDPARAAENQRERREC